MPYKQKHRTLSKPKPVSKSEHRHYWPYLPLVIITFGFCSVLLLSGMRATQVLSNNDGLGNDSLLSATNEARTKQRRGPLVTSTALSQAAQTKANDMVTRDYWSHTTPDGEQPWSFVDHTGYKYQVVGENLAYGFSSSDEVIRGWLNSASHRENLLSNDYSEVGFGIAQSANFNRSGPETVVVAMYATPGQLVNGTERGVLSKQLPANFSITRLETLTGSQGQLAVFAVGLLTGAVMIVMLVKHMAAVKRVVVDSEQFVIHHPVFDATLVALLIIGTFLAQTVGFVR